MQPIRRWLLLFSAALSWALAAPGSSAVDIGDRLELFVDQALFERLDGVELRLHPPRPAETALSFDRPWETESAGYVTVFRDGELYRMYYRGAEDGRGGNAVCYAESDDGIHWQRPELRLTEWDGSKANNVLFTGLGSHNFAPFLNPKPGAPPEKRYLALGRGVTDATYKRLYAFASSDALDWRLLQEEPVLTEGAFDSHNIAFWDAALHRYRCYYRVFRDGYRQIAMAESTDFLHWKPRGDLDTGNIGPEHLYTNAIAPYFRAPHLYFGFPKRFFPDRRRLPDHPHDGISEAIFFSSRDGLRFDRTFPEALIRPGRDPRNWGDRNHLVAWRLVPTGTDEMSIYYAQHNRYPSHRLRRGVFRLDGIASARAGFDGGELLTKPLRFAGRRLLLNFATSAGGFVQVEIQNSDGEPIPGFALDQAPALYGDAIEEEYSWESDSDLAHLAGQAIRLRFVLKDADVYSFRFAE